MTPKQYRDEVIGKTFDEDHAYGAQCWDLFENFIKRFNLGVSAYCSITKLACDLWVLRDKYNYSAVFDYIYDPKDLKDGDWCIWNRGSKSHPSSHIAMYMSPNVELGQNQGHPYVTEKTTDFSDIMGALRWKGWASIPYGASDITINDHSYSLYRQNPATEEPAVLSAGMNKIETIRNLDADVYVMSKVTGANYYQMKTDQEDPYGTTYGDLSAPLNDVWTEVPNQDTTLYFDVETGMYGDCTGVHINREHNVFSPAVVYPKKGNFQYARMVGIGHVNLVSRYAFVVRLTDGTYINGICNQDITPKQIATDFRTLEISSIAFLDGGGSAQFGRWNGKTFEYIRDTGRAVPSAFAIIQKGNIPPVVTPDTPIAPEEPSDEPVEDETQKDEETPMEENKTQESTITEVVKDETWTDPEPQPTSNIIVERIAALLSVKSLITIALTVAFIILVVKGKELPDQFVSIYTMCISFFFGYQFKKSESGGDGK